MILRHIKINPRRVCYASRTWASLCSRIRTRQKTLRLDKVNQALAMFGAQVSVDKLQNDEREI